MDYKTLRYERRDHLGILSLNRPERLNAMSHTLIAELLEFFSSLRADLQTRVVIVRGEGRAFCAGHDLDELDAEFGGDDLTAPQACYKAQWSAGELVTRMRRAPQPLIAAVRGPAAGGGLGIALACDVRIAGESARFNAAFVRIGLTAGDLGVSYHLPRQIGFSRASEYLLTGKFIGAAQAERFGLVSRVVPDAEVDAAAIALAEEMLQVSPLGLRLTKELLDFSAGSATLESALQMENRSQTMCMLTEDAKEGPRAFLEKRRPQWQDR